jgi:ABC-2 type transport system ATP-binding protein
MGQTILELKDLSKKYGSKTVLDQLSFSLEAGHIYGLVGNNGAGKSTLLRMITGLSRPTAGSISLFGSKSGRQLQQARLRVGALIETPAFYADMTIAQNLHMQAILCKTRLSGQEILDLRTELGIAANQIGELRLSQCSLGQRQRVGIAATLVGKPELLILDEPLNGLDPSGVTELRGFLQTLNQKGITMLISSHILEELHKLATDYIFLDRGAILQTITAAELEYRILEQQTDSNGDYDLEHYFLDLVR